MAEEGSLAEPVDRRCRKRESALDSSHSSRSSVPT